MSMPIEPVTTSATDQMAETMEPWPVFVTKDETRQLAAHYGSLQSFMVAGDSAINQPVQILNRRPTRSKAIVYNPVSATPSPVILSNSPGPLQQMPPIGFNLDSGQALELESQQPVWAIASVTTTGNVTLSVLDEAYISPEGN